MLRRLYIHNYKSFQNFEWSPGEEQSSLLIGKNGAGKSSLAKALQIFQQIGRGVNRVGKLVTPNEFFLGNTESPMRFAIDVEVQGRRFQYVLALELPEKFKEARILEERLDCNGEPIYVRDQAQVSLKKFEKNSLDARFLVDWHVIALPLIQETSDSDPVHIFKTWLAQMVILSPYPANMSGESTEESLWPESNGNNSVDWLAGILGQYPAAYTIIFNYLNEVMPDLQVFRYESLGKDTKRLIIQFASESSIFPIPFDELSDGEKCFLLCSVVVAANASYGPLFCFWDEPDNYLSLKEISHFIMQLRRAFLSKGQLIMTSHNEETIRRFSDQNTWIIGRNSHLEPTNCRLLGDLKSASSGRETDLIQSLMLGEI